MKKIGTDVQKAAGLLNAGKLVGLPTETVYGLAANALNREAVMSIFTAKKRPAFDPLIVHVHDAGEMEKYAYVDEFTRRLAARFCPGPVTFILAKKPVVPDEVTSGLATVGLRVPRHPIALELLCKLKFPLAAPSANLFGTTSPGTARDVEESLGEAVSFVLDGGACEVGVESTIIKLVDGEIEVLRLGGLALEEIEEAAGKKVQRVKTSSSRPEAPGMLHKHYNPGIAVRMVDFDGDLSEFEHKRIAVISFRTRTLETPVVANEALSKSGDVREAARNLFGALRRAGKSGADVILTELLPEEGLGRAVNDRLRRAAVE